MTTSKADVGRGDRPDARSNRRAELIAVAARLFEEEGYHQTSMDRLADEAGLAKPSLYHYFRSKEEILFEIHLQFIEPLIQRQLRRVEMKLKPSQMLLEIVVDHIEVLRDKPGLLRIFFEHQRELGPERRAEARRNRLRYRRLVEEVLLAGTEAGEIRKVDVRVATFALFGILNWAQKWYRPDGELSAREVAYLLWDLFWHGVGTVEPGH